MKFGDIEIKKKLDLDYKSNPYVVKKYAKNWSLLRNGLLNILRI